MSLDPASRPIDFRSKTLFADMGVRAVVDLFEDAKVVGTNGSLPRDRDTMVAWLGGVDGTLSPVQVERIGRAWRAWMASGRPPSLALEETFATMRRVEQKVGFDIERHMPPPEIIDVFSRLLASDEQIATKGLYDRLAARVATAPGAPSPKRQHSKWNPTRWSKATKIAIVACVLWVPWVLFRTSDSHELLGFWLEEWDDDMVEVNILLPIVVGIVGTAVYRWIKKSD